MRPPPLRREQPPLHEISNSLNNSLGIRVVPYSPPKPDYPQSPESQNTSRQLPSDRTNSSHSADDDATHAVQKSSSGGPGPGPPSCSSTLPGPSITSRAGFAVSDSASSTQSPCTPDLSTRSYSSSNCNDINAQTQPSQQDGRTNTPPSSSPHQRLLLPRRRIGISLNPDKTFSLVPHQHSQINQNDRHMRSPQLSQSTTTSAASDIFTDEQPPSSPLSTLQEHGRSLSPCSLTTSPRAKTATRALALISDNPTSPTSPPTSSPRNYHLVGGLRKVPKTPNLKTASAARPASYDPTPSEKAEYPIPRPVSLAPQPSESSLRSIDTQSTASETTNYQVHDFTSPYQPSPSEASDELNFRVIGQSPSPSTYQPSLSEASDELNFRIIGYSSSPLPSSQPSPSLTSDEPNFHVTDQSPLPSDYTCEPPTSPGSDDNYVVHGSSSPLYYSPIIAGNVTVRQQYSQESLVVSPLQPRHRRPVNRLGFYKSISRESLRRAASLKSISSVLSQELAHSVLLAAPAAVYLQGGPQAFLNIPQESRSKATLASPAGSATPPMISHSHQWSSHLSNVASESEEGIVPASSTSHQARRNSGFSRSHSRNMLSISSSVNERSVFHHSRSTSDSTDRPHATLARSSQRDLRQIRDQDEHGDGLTDLYVLHQRPSRTRLAALFSASPDGYLHSPTSSRANSFSSVHVSLPTWAKLYYGSGERKMLAISSESTFSGTCESGPACSTRTGSPSAEQFPAYIYNQRRRPRQATIKDDRTVAVRDASSDPGEVQDYRSGRFVRKQTSSVWSPHLRNDRRASRYSVWEPPTATWPADGPLLGRRNLQVIMFIMGFIFPFAWMIGACLPLPPNPQLEMTEGDGSTSRLDVQSSLPEYSMIPQTTYYEGARWWRKLNRYMSVVGLLVVGAVVALVVIGVRQDWGSRRA